MEQSSGGKDVRKLMGLWECFSLGSRGVCNDAKRLIDFVAEIINDPDPERLNNASGVLNANGLSIEQVQDKLLGAKNIKDAILKEFPTEGTDETD